MLVMFSGTVMLLDLSVAIIEVTVSVTTMQLKVSAVTVSAVNI